jgi:hypothetical protein
LRLPGFKTIGTLRCQGCQPYAPAAFTPRQEIFLVLISLSGGVVPSATVRPERLRQWEIPMTPSGIEPSNIRSGSPVPQPTVPPRLKAEREADISK